MTMLQRLKVIRMRRALSQRDLAEKAGVSPTTITQLENLKAPARPSTMRKLAAALGVEPEELIGDV